MHNLNAFPSPTLLPVRQVAALENGGNDAARAAPAHISAARVINLAYRRRTTDRADIRHRPRRALPGFQAQTVGAT